MSVTDEPRLREAIQTLVARRPVLEIAGYSLAYDTPAGPFEALKSVDLAIEHLCHEFSAVGASPLDVHIATLRHLLSVLVLRLVHRPGGLGRLPGGRGVAGRPGGRGSGRGGPAGVRARRRRESRGDEHDEERGPGAHRGWSTQASTAILTRRVIVPFKGILMVPF